MNRYSSATVALAAIACNFAAYGESANHLLGGGFRFGPDVEQVISYSPEFAGDDTSADEYGPGWKLLAGVTVARGVGAEVGYTGVGRSFAITGPGTGSFITSCEAIEFSGAVTGIYPLNGSFGLFGTVGTLHWGSDHVGDTRVGGTTVPLDADKAGMDVLVVFGGQYNLNDHTLFRFEWQHYNDLGLDAGRDTEVNVFGGSLQYQF